MSMTAGAVAEKSPRAPTKKKAGSLNRGPAEGAAKTEAAIPLGAELDRLKSAFAVQQQAAEAGIAERDGRIERLSHDLDLARAAARDQQERADQALAAAESRLAEVEGSLADQARVAESLGTELNRRGRSGSVQAVTVAISDLIRTGFQKVSTDTGMARQGGRQAVGRRSPP